MTDARTLPDAVKSVWSSGAPTLAPGGMAFLYDPAWGDGTARWLLRDGHGRMRSITAEPDGSLLVTTSNGGGNDKVLRVSPTAAGEQVSPAPAA